ncbi:MAG: hypothetical protein IMW89_01440 [Ktedonobacteraceae bacterium]|nr:hypothetical protein [Ktedonobacteraceae bacterium]
MRSERDDKAARMTAWEAALAYWRTCTDGSGYPIDESILETVAVLNLLSISTTSSCGGHADRGVVFPYVMLGVCSEEAEAASRRELDLANEEYIFQCEYGEDKRNSAWYERRALLRRWRPLHWESALLLMKYIDAFYQIHAPVSPEHHLIVRPLLSTGISILQPFHAAQQFTAIELTHDEKLALLAHDQEEMRSLTIFLKARYFAHTEKEVVHL